MDSGKKKRKERYLSVKLPAGHEERGEEKKRGLLFSRVSQFQEGGSLREKDHLRRPQPSILIMDTVSVLWDEPRRHEERGRF